MSDRRLPRFFVLFGLIIFCTWGGPMSAALPHIQTNNQTHTVTEYKLKVFDLNTWGLKWPWSEDRRERFLALRSVLMDRDYDIAILQEVWYKSDFDLIKLAMPYHTYFGVLNNGCSGIVLPIGCSGLLILSKHPMEKVELTPYSRRGSFWNFDGEVFVGKGLGWARIRFKKRITIDVFDTHLISYTINPNRDNTFFRFIQAYEAIKVIQASNADIKIFGGDLNALPYLGQKQPYGLLKSVLKDALTELYPDASFDPKFATFGNYRNTYSHKWAPERIDFLMYNTSEKVRMTTEKFAMPDLRAKNSHGEWVSLSDHEALEGTFLVEEISGP